MGIEAVAPEAPVVERVQRPATRQASTDSMVEDAISFLTDEAPGKRPKAEAEPAPPKPREIPLPPDEEEEEQGDGEEVEGEDYDGDTGSDDQPGKAAAHAQEPIIGSKETPYPAEQLPEDRFVRLTVDGEEVVVNFKEIARSYIGIQTTNKRLAIAADALKHSEAYVAKAKEDAEYTKSQLNDLLNNDEELFDFLLHRNEDILVRVAQRMAARSKYFRENPQALYQERLAREKAKLDAERESLRAENQRAQQELQQKQQFEQWQRMFVPGWNEGLRKAGFPELTEPRKRELYEEVNHRCRRRAESGKVVTTADVTDFVVRSCKMLEMGPKGSKPAPVQKPPQRAPQQPRRNGHDPKWDGVPVSRRIRNDPDFLLQGISLKEFRR